MRLFIFILVNLSGKVRSLQQLLGLNASMEKGVNEISPLLAAAMSGQHETLSHIIWSNNYTPREVIDALELLGAAFVDEVQDMTSAMEWWKLAMTQRLTEGYHKPSAEPHAAYNWAVEAQTMDDLDILVHDPDGLKMQALLIRERILGPAHPKTSYYIFRRGAKYVDYPNNIDTKRCIELWMYGLNMQQRSLPPLCNETLDSFFAYVNLLVLILSDIRSDGDFTDIYVRMDVFEKLVMEANRGKAAMQTTNNNEMNFDRFVKITMFILKLFCNAERRLSEEQVLQFKQLACQLVKLNLQGEKGFTLMHFACTEITSTVDKFPMCHFPELKVLEFLIDVGGDVNCRDTAGNTPLHVAALARPCIGNIIDTLLQAGAHVDYGNDERKSPHELVPADTACDLHNPLTHQSLQCLAARAIRRHNLAYEKVLTPELEGFVKDH